MARLQLRRGLKTNVPTTGMLNGEPHFTTDRGTLHVATGATTSIPVVPPVEDLTTIGTIDGAADLLLIHDGSDTAEKKVTFNAFKTALNIPAGSTDEATAAIDGGATGSLYGTDGTDGVLRLNNSLSYTPDGGNAFVTIAVETVDGGTF
jgi:hypothetical protein